MYSAGPSGLYNAPVTKLLLFGSFAINLSVNYVIMKKGGNVDKALSLGNGLQSFICSQFLYSNIPEMFFGFMFIYSFRLFERMMGSSKYALFYLSTTGLSALLQFSINVFSTTNSKLILKSSPFSFIFSCLVLFYKDVPSTMWFKLFRIPMNDKMITYGLALQTLIAFPTNITTSVIGVVSGLIASSKLLGLPFINFPKGVRSMFSLYILPLIQSNPTVNSTSYRTQLERNQRRQAQQDLNNPMAAFQQQINQLQQMSQQQQQIPVAPPTTPPSEENIQILIGMGFPRSRAVDVLTRTNNNLNEAASII